MKINLNKDKACYEKFSGYGDPEENVRSKVWHVLPPFLERADSLLRVPETNSWRLYFRNFYEKYFDFSSIWLYLILRLVQAIEIFLILNFVNFTISTRKKNHKSISPELETTEIYNLIQEVIIQIKSVKGKFSHNKNPPPSSDMQTVFRYL